MKRCPTRRSSCPNARRTATMWNPIIHTATFRRNIEQCNAETHSGYIPNGGAAMTTTYAPATPTGGAPPTGQAQKVGNWYDLTPEAVAQQLQVDPAKGLTAT